MSFLEEAKKRIALMAQSNESAPEPDDAERKFRRGMSAILETINAVDEQLIREMMTVLLDQLERRFAGNGKQPEQPEEQQPAANAQRSGPKTPDLESYFSTPANKPGSGSKIPDFNSYFE